VSTTVPATVVDAIGCVVAAAAAGVVPAGAVAGTVGTTVGITVEAGSAGVVPVVG
jgi:hypothetical protein